MSEIIWQSVLGELKETMPRSAFETWVADTQFLSSNDTLFLVGCRNASVRDWLENRLLSTVERMLVGRLNHSVTVSFVVTGDQVGESENGEREPAEDELQVEAFWDFAYEQVVQPERAIAINAYFLRYLRLLGPELGWLYVGFRQAAYSAGGRSGNRTARFTGETVAALSGMSKRAFWRRVGSQETWRQLAGLVNLVGEKPMWDEKSPTPKRLPRKYPVAMTLPLTPADARSLMHWISAHMEEAGGQVGVLELACKTPVEEIIPADAASPINHEPLAVSQLVRELFSDDIPEADLKALAERLRMHLMPPGDLVMISLFFVEHVLPHLGTGPGWMLTILRDRCWINPESGEARNRVTVKGGYADIAGWMGLERAMTVYEWLHGKQRKWLPVREAGETTKKPNPKAGQYLNPALRIYVREVGQGVGDFAEGSREFDVLLDEIPAEIMAAIVKEDPSAIYAIGTIGFTQLAQDIHATGTIGFTQLAQELYATGRVFKLLSSLKPALKTLLKTTTENSENFETVSETQKPVVMGGEWDLSSLFRANGVSRKKQKQLLDAGATGQAFASWLLYGYTSAGKGLTDLVGNAIQSTLATPNAGAGGVCDLLAGYGPGKLESLLADSLRGAMVANNSFLSAFGHLSVTQKQELLMRIGARQVEIHERIPVYEKQPPQESASASERSAEELRELLRRRSRDSRIRKE